MSVSPIFLISQPRSGSTLLQAVLSNHGDVATVAESWLQLTRLPYLQPERFRSDIDWKLCLEAVDEAGKTLNMDLRRTFDAKLLEVINAYYKQRADGKRYFLDKTPRYYYLLEQLFLDFPNGRFILLQRHPAAVVQSIEKTWKIPVTSKALFWYADDLLLCPDIMANFQQRYTPNRRVYTLSYEDILETPSETLSALFHWLDLEYTPEMLNYKNNSNYRGHLGDPIAPTRSLLEPRILPKGEAFLGPNANGELVNFCRGLVAFYERMDFPIPRRDWWLSGKATKEFDYFLRKTGRSSLAQSGIIGELQFRIECWRRRNMGDSN